MDPAQLQPGYRLDRYELLCPLAYGGMASVWLARFGGRLGFERMVVIKMILPQYSQDPRFKEMFLDEARIASKIEHTNVARILDVGEDADNYFIVMEWVDGDSLSKIMREVETRKEQVPAGIALRIVADAAAGLHAAHQLKDREGALLGVVHRDVSPQNILVANNGTTMIIDFGVAKARDRLSQDTSAGQLKGKIRYMAPEQALGRSVDHRADVWALGAMLYEMFIGAPPYDGPNEVATLHKLTSGQRPAPIPHTVPEPVRSIIERSLGYEPEERFESALEMNLALESAMVEINEPTSPAVVAAYTGDLLSDRKAARRGAVEAALDKARKRDDRRAANSAHGDAAYPSSSGHSSRSGSGAAPIHSSPPPNESSVPSRTGERMSLNAEAPSNATLGSANMEYLPDTGNDDLRKRRYFGAVALGVSFAVGLAGIVLIVSTVKTGQKPEVVDVLPVASTSTAPRPTAPPVETVTAPPQASAEPQAAADATVRVLDAAPNPTTTTDRHRRGAPNSGGAATSKPNPTSKGTATEAPVKPPPAKETDPWGLTPDPPKK